MKIIYSILLVLITLQLIACGGADERKAAYLEKADKSLQAGDLDKARIELKNVLQIDPKDARAYFKLGNVFEAKKNFNKAFGYYSKAVDLNPDNSEYQAKIGRFYLVLAGNIDKATEKMTLILSKDKNNPDGLLLEAAIYLKQQKIKEAQDISEGLLKAHPENIENVALLSAIYDLQKDYKKSVSLINTTLKLVPDNLQLQNLLANVLYLDNDLDGAEKVFRQILNAHPDKYDNYKTLALFYQKTGKPEKAEATLNDAVNADDADVQRKLVLIQYITQTKGIDASLKAVESMIKKNPNQSEIRLLLAKLQLDNHDTAAAISTFKDIVNDFPQEEGGITARVSLAKLYMQKNDEKTASKYIEDAVAISPNSTEVNFVKAKIAITNKDYEHAITSLRTVIKNDPSNIEAYVLLAESHKANKEPDQAKVVMSNAYENNRDNSQALSQLARFYVRTKDIAGAEQVIDNYLKLSPNDYEALSLKASILNTNKKYSEAQTLASKLIKLYPDKDNGYIQSVPELLSNKKFDSAVKMLKDGYKKTNSAQMLKLMSQLQMTHGKTSEAIDALKSIDDKSNDESVQLLLAKAYMDEKDFDSAEKVLISSIKQDKTHTRSYMYLANLYLQEKLPEKCVSILNQGIIANPDDVSLSATLAGYYEKSKDFKNAINVYESILAITPNNIVIANNLATLLVDTNGDAASIKKAKQLTERLKNSNQPVILDTVGWVDYKSGDYSSAINVLKKVATAMPDVPVFNYHLGMAYYKSGDKANAKTYLQKSLEKKTYFDGIDEARNTLKQL